MTEVDKLASYLMVEAAYRDRAVRTIHSRDYALAQPGVGPKTYRKWVREALETWRYSRSIRKAYEQGGPEAASRQAVYGFKFRWQRDD